MEQAAFVRQEAASKKRSRSASNQQVKTREPCVGFDSPADHLQPAYPHPGSVQPPLASDQHVPRLSNPITDVASHHLPHHAVAAHQAAQALQLAGLLHAYGGNPAVASGLSRLAALLASFATARALAETTTQGRQHAINLVASLQQQADLLSQSSTALPFVASQPSSLLATGQAPAQPRGMPAEFSIQIAPLVAAVQQYAAVQQQLLGTPNVAAVGVISESQQHACFASEGAETAQPSRQTAVRACTVEPAASLAAGHHRTVESVDKATMSSADQSAMMHYSASHRQAESDAAVELPMRKRRKYTHESFARRLFRLLMDVEAAGLTDIVSFNERGDAVVIKKPAEFAETIVPRYFSHNRFRSFRRQLSVYGFRRHKAGPDKGAYSHRFFIRGRPELLEGIEREVVPPSEKDNYGRELEP